MRILRSLTGCLAATTLVSCVGVAPNADAPRPSPQQDTPVSVGSAPAPSSMVSTAATAATETTVRVGPLTPRDPGRITATDRAAIEAIGNSGAADPADGTGHTHGPHVEMPLLTGDAIDFADQWLAAQRSTDRFDTIAEIESLGYVRSSAPIAGISGHWVLWPKIAQPFDPAWPAMVLLDESKHPARLVGYSYWLQSVTEPDGFAGSNDQWHQHQGLCVVNGWVDRERSTGPDACGGTYFAGGDLWMLHAWPVPGYESNDGKFSTFNSKLCPAAAGAPDIARCPDQ